MTPEALKTYDMARLCDLLEATTSRKYSAQVAMVRGWIMDAMEAKNPDGFNAWLDSDDNHDADARKYLLGEL